MLKDIIISEYKKEGTETMRLFIQDTKSKEILIVILKAHLYMERELIKMLTETIIDEKILSGTTFRQKLDLANSMGLLIGVYGAVGKVNSIRNSYAHTIGYEIDEAIFEDLLSTLTKEDKDDYLAEYENWKTVLYDDSIPELNFKLQVLLCNIWLALLACRVHAKNAVELRLKEKELNLIERYVQTEQ